MKIFEKIHNFFFDEVKEEDECQDEEEQVQETKEVFVNPTKTIQSQLDEAASRTIVEKPASTFINVKPVINEPEKIYEQPEIKATEFYRLHEVISPIFGSQNKEDINYSQPLSTPESENTTKSVIGTIFSPINGIDDNRENVFDEVDEKIANMTTSDFIDNYPKPINNNSPTIEEEKPHDEVENLTLFD